jgi:hypothetical protein
MAVVEAAVVTWQNTRWCRRLGETEPAPQQLGEHWVRIRACRRRLDGACCRVREGVAVDAGQACVVFAVGSRCDGVADPLAVHASKSNRGAVSRPGEEARELLASDGWRCVSAPALPCRGFALRNGEVLPHAAVRPQRPIWFSAIGDAGRTRGVDGRIASDQSATRFILNPALCRADRARARISAGMDVSPHHSRVPLQWRVGAAAFRSVCALEPLLRNLARRDAEADGVPHLWAVSDRAGASFWRRICCSSSRRRRVRVVLEDRESDALRRRRPSAQQWRASAAPWRIYWAGPGTDKSYESSRTKESRVRPPLAARCEVRPSQAGPYCSRHVSAAEPFRPSWR